MIIDLKTIAYKERPVFEKMVISLTVSRIPKKFQKDEACFLILNDGQFKLRTPTQMLSFEKGDAMLSKCGNYFIENTGKNRKDLSAIAVYFYPEIVKGFFKNNIPVQNLRSKYDTLKVDVAPWLRSFMDSIDFLIENQELVNDELVENKLNELLILLTKTVHAESIIEFISSLFTPHEYNFKEIIQNNIYSNLSIKELAKLTNSSVSTFKRKFSNIFNASPAQYMRKKKIERASSLLQLKSMSIADVSFACGFENVSSFSKAFKQHMKMAPSAYRLKQQGKSK